MKTDPFKQVSINLYKEYVSSTLKYESHWKYKRVYCPVCDCTICYPRCYEHKFTKKHQKNLRKLW